MMFARSTRTVRLALATFAATAVLGAATDAQCPFPDSLDGACCSSVNLTVPTFPGFTIQGSGFCWTDCVLGASRCVDISVSMPIPATCAQYQSQLTVSDCTSGQAIMSSFPLVLDFTRTWTEVSDSGSNYQVWRFAAKADLGLGTSPGCPMPPCIGPNPTAFFYGYVDYARNCDAGGLEYAVVHALEPERLPPGLREHVTSSAADVVVATLVVREPERFDLGPLSARVGELRPEQRPTFVCLRSSIALTDGFRPLKAPLVAAGVDPEDPGLLIWEPERMGYRSASSRAS